MENETDKDDRPDPKKRGLGRGLNALFEDEEGVYPQVEEEGQTPGARRMMAGVDQLEPGVYQPRKNMDKDSLQELAESIAAHGVLQPIIVRPKPGHSDAGVFEIIAGERRWRASQLAQLHEVPIIVKDFDDETTLEIALIENLQREDLNALEEAQGYQQLMEEFSHTQEKVAAMLGKSRSHVANMVRLLTLPSSVQKMLRDGKLTAGHARALITADNPEEMAKTIVNQGLSVREAERLAADESGRTSKKKSSSGKPAKDVDTIALEEEVSNVLGMKVSVDMKKDGQAGSLKIDFKNLDQLDELLHRLSHYPGRQQTG